MSTLQIVQSFALFAGNTADSFWLSMMFPPSFKRPVAKACREINYKADHNLFLCGRNHGTSKKCSFKDYKQQLLLRGQALKFHGYTPYNFVTEEKVTLS